MQSPVRHKKCRPARGSGATSGKTAKQQNRKSRPKATRRNAGVLFGRQAAATQPAARFCQILRQSFLVRTPQKARLFPAAFAARLLAVSCPAAARRPPFARRAAFETIPPRFVKGEIPHTVADDFSDEICLAMQTARGLVVLVGCSHPGILNMIRTVHEVLQQPVYAVFGGTHLVEADEARIEATIKELQNLGMSVLGLCHCSGALAEDWMTCHSTLQACHMAVGDCIAFE